MGANHSCEADDDGKVTVLSDSLNISTPRFGTDSSSQPHGGATAVSVDQSEYHVRTDWDPDNGDRDEENEEEVNEDEDNLTDSQKVRRSLVRSSLILAGLDFGTTYSGYAYSMWNDYNIDPLRIIAKQSWKSSDGSNSPKTPSAILFKPDKSFHSFGFDAISYYGELFLEDDPCPDEDPKNWYFFQNFKMLLYREQMIGRESVLKDEGGKPLPALYVFSESIRYLRESLIGELRERLTNLEEKDLYWVLTVPAIWSDRAKQFMREAAVKAGIPGEGLTLALEPEAAAVYCKYLALHRVSSETGARMQPLPVDSRFMVIDLGGGTIDITLYSITDDGVLRELYPSNGGDWGGNLVNITYLKFINMVIGDAAFSHFKENFYEDYLQLIQDFETRKRRKFDQILKLTLPAELGNACLKAHDKSFSQLLAEKFPDKGITASRDKLQIKCHRFKEFFKPAIQGICDHVAQILKSLPQGQDPSTFLMVGGFADCVFVREELSARFPGKNIIIPQNAVSAVMKGAILFGRDPSIIASRAVKHTYGIEVWPPFRAGYHPAEKKQKVGGKWVCGDVFRKHVEAGTITNVGEAMDEIKYTAVERDQDEMCLPIFVSTDKSPSFVTDDSCTYLGTLNIDMRDTTGGDQRAVFVRMIFEGTEFAVEARDETTGSVACTRVDFLG